MYLVGLGVIFMLLKYFEVSPVAEWSWWWVLSPFAGAFVWWNWADATGYTKRKAMEREERERMERRDRQMEAIGQKPRSRSRLFTIWPQGAKVRPRRRARSVILLLYQ